MSTCTDYILPKDVTPDIPVWKVLLFIPEHIILACLVYFLVFVISMFGFHFIILFALIGVILFYKDKIVGKPKIIACISVLVVVIVLQVVEVVFIAFPMWRSLATHPNIYTIYPLIGVAIIAIVFDVIYFRQVIFKSKESNKDNINQPLLGNYSATNPPPLPPKPAHLLNKGPPPPLPPKPNSTPPPLPPKPLSLTSSIPPVSPPSVPARPPRPYPVSPTADAESAEKLNVPTRPPRPETVKEENLIVENNRTNNIDNEVKIEIQS